MTKRISVILLTSILLSGCQNRSSVASPKYAPSPMFIGGLVTAGLRSGAAASFTPGLNTESYSANDENPFKSARRDPLSTFSIDVDTASYANLRRFVRENERPPAGAIRVEELINYFDYNYPSPQGETPFGVHTEVASCPWNPNHRLALIGLRSSEIPATQRPAANLVFLLDISGSMSASEKLPLVQKSMRMLVGQLQARDRVAIVTYAGEDKIALAPTSCSQKDKIITAIDELGAGGSTYASGGIKKAYELARKNFQPNGLNRIILATDGDFNVGITNDSDLKKLIKKEASSGVSLTALGFGMGNLKDSTLQTLAQNGNGQHAYIDSELEARKVLVKELGATLQTVAKDVKIQVEFNPTTVKSYRLIGYESRLLAAEDFADDQKDAGDMGAGHRVTALYEIVPPGAPDPVRPVDALKYQKTVPASGNKVDLFTLKIRYKEPRGFRSKLITKAVPDSAKPFAQASSDFRFASSVAAFGLLLSDSNYKGTATRSKALSWASSASKPDPNGLRRDFLSLARKAKLPK
jgi:Ca-activated chloride channel homolog